MNDIVLKKANGEIYTTSLLLAEKFEKRHDRVIRKIESLSSETFSRLKIGEAEYNDDQGKPRKMYELNRDAFSFIAMGFTGKKADEWKLKYIDAFNKMEKHLKNMFNLNWIEHRTEAALEYKMMARTLQEVRKLEGKETKSFHYANEAKLVNWALTGEFKRVDRNQLDDQSLRVLVDLEAYNAVLLAVKHDRDTRKELLKNRYSELTIDKLDAD